MYSYRLGRRAGEWLREPGPEGDVAISTRIRLARNIRNFPFAARLNERDARQLTEHLRKKLSDACRPQRLSYLNLGTLDPIWRRVLVERHLISREHAHRDPSHGVVIGTEEITSIMLNEEDHLRIQILRSGFRTSESLKYALALDKKIGKILHYTKSKDFGYLTSCPTNAGTGLRVSVMLHLPALVLNTEIRALIDSCSARGIEVRGFYGEGTRAHGDLFQFSNRITMGKTEQEIVEQVEEIVHEVIQRERSARKKLLKSGKSDVSQRIQNVVTHCVGSQTITASQSMSALSLLRMGIHLGVLDRISIARVNELFLWTQPGHLQHLVGRNMTRSERDAVRAQLVKRWCARHIPQWS